jgi:LDH2 family malate/lactate/ureidoglycolate dehydrogenase
VFVQALDPRAFGGLDAFRRQMDWLVDACHDAKPRMGVERVRLPGERGLASMRDQLERGIALYPTILPSLDAWSKKLGVPMVAPL